MKSFFLKLFTALAALNLCMAYPLQSEDGSVKFSVLSPTEGSVYSYGDNISIVWVDSDSTVLNIDLVDDNTSVPIFQNIESTQGQYVWTIPQNLSNSVQGLYKIQITFGNTSIYSGKFTIEKGTASPNDTLPNNVNSINKDPMSGAKATASITIIGSENQQKSLATINISNSHTIGAVFLTAIIMTFL